MASRRVRPRLGLLLFVPLLFVLLLFMLLLWLRLRRAASCSGVRGKLVKETVSNGPVVGHRIPDKHEAETVRDEMIWWVWRPLVTGHETVLAGRFMRGIRDSCWRKTRARSALNDENGLSAFHGAFVAAIFFGEMLEFQFLPVHTASRQ